MELELFVLIRIKLVLMVSKTMEDKLKNVLHWKKIVIQVTKIMGMVYAFVNSYHVSKDIKMMVEEMFVF